MTKAASHGRAGLGALRNGYLMARAGRGLVVLCIGWVYLSHNLAALHSWQRGIDKD